VKIVKSDFLEQCVKRLEQGAVEYGDESFYSPTEKLVADIEEELLDVANWSSILAVSGTSHEAKKFLAWVCRWARMVNQKLDEAKSDGLFDRQQISKKEAVDFVDETRKFLKQSLGEKI
tara:strand:- start:2205 stop:2561 length:357 start_codon:yes stop_codon:yes gene_type:complete